jgi:hypothetical protein
MGTHLESIGSSRLADETQLHSAFEILHYNQDLIQFFDGKANTLIVINSIALASSAGLRAMGFGSVFLVAAIISILLCLRVVMAKPPQAGPHGRDLIFFADITSRPERLYRFDFLRTDPHQMLNALLSRTWRLAAIADRKYETYRVAQNATVVTCVLWMAAVVVSRF